MDIQPIFRCAVGMDVPLAVIQVGVILAEPGGEPAVHQRQFGAFQRPALDQATEEIRLLAQSRLISPRRWSQKTLLWRRQRVFDFQTRYFPGNLLLLRPLVNRTVGSLGGSITFH